MWLIKRLFETAALFLAPVLFIVLVPLFLNLIHQWGPYEDAQNTATNQNGLPIKVVKVGEGNRLFLEWCCRESADGVVDQDRYVRALEMGHGVEGGPHYSLEVNSTAGVRVTLSSSGDVFVYDIQGGQIRPIKRKVINAWKIVSSWVGALLTVVLLTRFRHI
jgi:hypothetical protein